MKLNNKHAVFHKAGKPSAGAGPPENSCWEWNLEQTLWSTVFRSEETEALDTSTRVSILRLPEDHAAWGTDWRNLVILYFPGRLSGPHQCPPTFREPEKTRSPAAWELLFPASGEQLCCRTGLESCNYPDRIRAIFGRSCPAAKAFDFLN